MFILIIKQKASISCITRQNGLFWQLSKISRMFGGFQCANILAGSAGRLVKKLWSRAQPQDVGSAFLA